MKKILAALVWLALSGGAMAQSPGMGSPMVPVGGGMSANGSNAILPQARTNLGIGFGVAPGTPRNPLPSDDTNAGYTTTSIWLGADGKTIWTPQRVTAGKALWEPTTIVARPLDVQGSAGVAYGVVCLSTAYCGTGVATPKAIQLTRASDSTTKDVLFLSNGELDVATGDAFCANTTCNMTTLYDQSGSGLNCTNSAANAPLWSSTNTVNGRRAIVFNSRAHAVTNLSTLAIYCTFATLSWNPSSSSVLMSGIILNSKSESRVLVEEPAGTRGFTTEFGNNGWALTGLNRFCGSSGAGSSEANPQTFGFTLNSSTFTCFQGDTVTSAASAAGASFTGGHIGTSTVGSALNADMIALILWPSTLSNANFILAQQSLASLTSTPPQVSDVVMIDGDSMSMGAGSSFDNSWPRLTAPFLSRPVRMYNISLFGQSLSTMVTNISAKASGLYSSSYRTFTVILLAGVNDIRSSTAIGTIEANFQTYISTIHALGSNARVLLATYPVQCDISNNSGQLTELQQMNNWIYSLPLGGGGSNPDGIVDFFADPSIGPGSYSAGNSWFCGSPNANSPDGQHPTDLTMGYFAPIAASAINNVLQ